MRIRYERAGGVGGSATRKDVTVDTADLPAPAAAELHRLIEAADLPGRSALPAAPRNPQARDQFHYRVTVEDQGQRHSLVFSDLDMPEGVRPLIDWLHEHSSAD